MNSVKTYYNFISFQLLKPFLKEHEMTNRQEWLDLVWSLIVLQKFDKDLLTSVLDPKFISKLTSSDSNISFYYKFIHRIHIL